MAFFWLQMLKFRVKCCTGETLYYLWDMQNETNMNQAISLINRAFDADGFLKNPKSKKNQNEARAILESGLNLYGKMVDGFDAHASLLMIAHPDQAI